ncbi:MAG: hypothetical protein ACI4OU_02760 [Candidatus Enterenecus sp.]
MEERTERGREMYELGLRLGALGTVAIGSAGGSLAKALARCVGCGVALAGGEARFHDGDCAACGVWLTKYYGMAAGVFLRQEGGEVRAWVTDGGGLPFSPPAAEVTAPCTGSWDALTGANCGWAARRAAGRSRMAAVCCDGPAALRLLLERLGCDVLDRPRPGVPLLTADREGFSLTVEWNGARWDPPGEDALAAAAAWLTRDQAVPAFKIEKL